MRRAIVVLVLIAASGCTAPGEPPHHTDPGSYQDVMRRELSTAVSALQTARLTLNYAAHDRITDAYAITLLDQSRSDLVRVSTDLRQIDPPAVAAAAQRELLALTTASANRLGTITSHWPPPSGIVRVSSQVKAESATAQRLEARVLTG